MKKLILALLAAGTIVTANAQEPHSILLYGDVSLMTNKEASTYKTTDWHASPGVGYQFNHNWTLGLTISWGQHATKDSTSLGTKNTFNLYKVGPFCRYSHYIRRSETFYYYSQLDFDYAGGYHTSGGNSTTDKHTGIYAGLYPALGINVGRGLGINFSIGGISYSTDKYTGQTTHNTVNPNNIFNLTFGQTVNFGLSKNFNCGHKMHSHHEPGDEVHRRKMDKMEDEDDAAPKPKKKERNRDDDE